MSQPQPYDDATRAPTPPAYGPPPGWGQAPAPTIGGQPGSPAPYGQPAPTGYGQQPPAAYAQQAPAAYGQQAPGAFAQPPTEYGQPGAPYGQLPAYGQQAGLAVTSCRFCGSVPAVDTKFRSHRGMLYIMQFRHLEGPFCRDCGLHTFRRMTSDTLVQGWWGLGSMIITPITVLINLIRRGKVAKLAPPQPNPYGPSRPPMDAGARLLQRPLTWVGLAIPLILIGLFVIAANSN